MDDGRRCALPGCDRTIPTTDGRPERRYCTAAHRAAARQARRAALQAEQRDGPERLAETLPWLREPADAPEAPRPVEASEPGPVVQPPRERRAPRPAGRALAMLGVAGILAGGYATTDAPPEPASSPVRAAPEGEPADAWAQRASIALTSVNQELDVLDQAEAEWRRLPENRRAVVPAPVVALEERRSVLQGRRATLQSQLDAYRSLRQAQQELAVSEQHLRAVETALADAPPQRRRSAEQEAEITALNEQRDLRLRRRDAQRAELESLQEGVSTATRTPLPDDAEATAEVSREVREVVRNGGTVPTRSADPTPPQPDVVAGREEEDDRPREEVGTSGPPDPRGPRDESEERRAAREKQGAAEREEADRDEPEAEASADPTEPSDEPGAARDDERVAPARPPVEDERAEDATLAELRERAMEVAREARKAEAARRAASRGGAAGKDAADRARRTESDRAARKPSPTPRPRPSDSAADDERPGRDDKTPDRDDSAAPPSDGDGARAGEHRDAGWRPSPKKRDTSDQRDREHPRRTEPERSADEAEEPTGGDRAGSSADRGRTGVRPSPRKRDASARPDDDARERGEAAETDERKPDEKKSEDRKSRAADSDDHDSDDESDASVGRRATTSRSDRS